MIRLRRLAARIRRALGTADALAIAGIASLTIGGWLVLPSLGLTVLGLSLLIVARYGTEAN